MHRIRHPLSLSLESDTAERLSGEVKEQRVAIEESMHLQFKDAISCHREQIEFHRKKLIGLEDNIQKEKAKVDSETKHVERDLKRAQEKEMRLSTNFEKDRVRYAMELEKNLTESVVKAHATAILIRASCTTSCISLAIAHKKAQTLHRDDTKPAREKIHAARDR